MDSLRAAAEMALEALEVATTPLAKDRQEVIAAQKALRQALAQPEQEPEKEKEPTVRAVDPRLLLGRSNNFIKETENRLFDIERRLAVIETQPAPPKREWVGLTDEERRHYNNRLSGSGVAEEIEAKLKEKNT